VRRNLLLPWVLLAPSMLLFAVFSAGPIVLMVQQSFFRTNYILSLFVGLKNFAAIARDELFGKSIVNTLKFAAILIPFQTLVPLVIALVVVNARKWLQDYTRFAFYAPAFASGIIVATVWQWIFHPTEIGLANYLLGLAGAEPVIWFGRQMTAIGAICIIILTTYIGSYVLIYLATMMAISPELYDAARVDGATWMQVRFRVIVPMISPTIGLVMIMVTISAMQIWALVFLLTNGGPNYGTTTMMFNIYEEGFLYQRYGYASAKSFILFLTILALVLAQQRFRGLQQGFRL